MNATHTVHEVLAPTLARCNTSNFRHIKPLPVEPGSDAEQLLTKAAGQIRFLMNVGRRSVPYEPSQPEVFFDACADTYSVRHDLEEVLDEKSAAIAAAIFERAGWSENLRPTTLAAQVEMQKTVVETIRAHWPLFAKQASLLN